MADFRPPTKPGDSLNAAACGAGHKHDGHWWFMEGRGSTWCDGSATAAKTNERSLMERQATYPDQEGVRPLTIEQVAAIVVGRIKTAFAPPNEIDDPETLRKAEWVVNGIEKWGETES